jgi:hypothetical protein
MTLRYPEVFNPAMLRGSADVLIICSSFQGSDARRERGSQFVLPLTFTTVPMRGVCSRIPDVTQEIPSANVFSEVCGPMVYHHFR